MTCALISSQKISWATPCTPNPKDNTLLIELSAIDDIRPGEAFNLTVDSVMNPNSTYPSDKFEVTLYDSAALKDLASLAKPTNKDPGTLFVQTSIPFVIPQGAASFKRSNLIAGLSSTYTLKMKLSHNIETGGGILIRYPP